MRRRCVEDPAVGSELDAEEAGPGFSRWRGVPQRPPCHVWRCSARLSLAAAFGLTWGLDCWTSSISKPADYRSSRALLSSDDDE